MNGSIPVIQCGHDITFWGW